MRRVLRLTWLLLVCLAARPFDLAAQSAAPTSTTPPTKEAVQGALNPLDAPNGTSTATTYQPKVTIDTSTDKSTASLNVAGVVTSHDADFVTVSFLAKAPFDSSKSDVVDLGSLSGLTAGTHAHLAVGWSRWPMIKREGIADILGFQNSSYFMQLYGGYPWDKPTVADAPTLRDVLVALKLAPSEQTLLQDEGTYGKVVAELNKEIDAYNAKTAGTGVKKLARVTPVSNFTDIAEQADRAYFTIAEKWAPSLVPSLSFTLDGNQQSFSWVTANNPAKVSKEDKNGAGASLVASALGPTWLASLSYSYAQSWTGQPSGQVCSPIPNTSASNCVTAALGAPTERIQRLITAEYRKRLGATFALSPQVQYDTSASKWAVNLPIYLVADASKVLNGGVTLGWTTASHFGAAVFIGKPFSF
jgi:hypothetical protein